MEILALGAIGFWILITLAVIIEIFAVEKENGVLSTLTLIITFVVVGWANNKLLPGFLDYLFSKPLTIILYIIGYFFIGSVWSFFKWYFFLLRKKEYLLERQRTAGERSVYKDIHESDIPNITENKGKILFWMSHWPISAFWTLINDPVKRTFTVLFYKLGGVYNRIASKVFEGVVTKK